MSLYLELQINDDTIGTVAVTRTTSAPGGDDAANTYRWSYRRNGAEAVGTVTHRYGDGAITLAHKVLGEIAQRHQAAAHPSPRLPQRKPPKWSGA